MTHSEAPLRGRLIATNQIESNHETKYIDVKSIMIFQSLHHIQFQSQYVSIH